MKKVIKYNIAPAKGQAILNFNDRRFPDTVELFETNLVEEVRSKKPKQLNAESDLNPDFRNLLIHGDCLSACAYLKSKNIKVDLVYIDPPFASGANYSKKIFLRNGDAENIKNDDSSIGEEILYSDIWQKEDYLNWLYERLLAIREVMSAKSCIYVHLDWHIGHYVKILMDEIFGEENFINDIIWSYRSGGASKESSLPRKHDIIFLYSNNNNNEKEVVINSIMERQYLEKPFMGSKVDENGNYYVDTLLRDVMEGVICRVLEDGSLKEYNTRPVLNLSKERVEYNTQKPEGLIELLVDIATTKGMIVADLFNGSGTAVSVAASMDRKYIGCDIGINSIQTTRDRLVEDKADFDIIKVNDGVKLFRNPAQTTAKLFSLIDGFKTKTELQLGEFWDGGIVGKNGSYAPVKFIGLHERLTKELLDIILEEIYQLQDSSNEIEGIKIIYAHKDLEIDQEYVDKEIRRKRKTDLKVEVIDLNTILGSKSETLFTPDNADVEMVKDGAKYSVKINSYFSSYLKNKIDDYNAKPKKNDDLIDEENETGGGKKFTPIKLSKNGLELIESVQFDTTLREDGVWISNLDLEDKAGIKEKIKAKYVLNTNKFKMKIRNIAGDEIIIDSTAVK
ncbi:site-specific DNA-methyltransferase [candidate division TA06 bacterium]|uniref:Site-specific DNA-methyltransferase n=1 Tax=candidate division TA06 bacterium TaxID=2250710 RepID=A0A933IAF7_UNCT6|nr:site-specific DNA-methyltransferase [candidate division TA06 bacterium]